MSLQDLARGHISARGRWQLHYKQATQQHGRFSSQGCSSKAVHHRERRWSMSGHRRTQQPLLLPRASPAHLSPLLSKSREPGSPGTRCGEESCHPPGAAGSPGRLCAGGQSPDTASGWSSALPAPLPRASLPSPVRGTWRWLCQARWVTQGMGEASPGWVCLDQYPRADPALRVLILVQLAQQAGLFSPPFHFNLVSQGW